MKLDRFERHPLTFGPSPVHPLRRLTEYLGGAEIWAKREDVNSGLAFGGNKTRKLEYFLPDVFAQGCDTLVSIGGVQSNHTRQVAAVAAATGLKCRLVQEAWVEWPDVVYDRVGNILLTRIMGAKVELVNAGFDIGFRESWERALGEVKAAGGKPYAIPAGGSDHRLGGLGFVNFALEVQRQEQELGIFFDHIIVCTVTGSTQAGMIVGFAAQDRPRKVIGIDASAKPEATRLQVKKIAQNTADLVELGREITDEDVIIDERFAGELYGIPVESTLRAMRIAGQLEGMLTDPVYEGKSMDGLIGLVQSGEIPKGAKVLYVHLGGAPALSAYASLFKQSQPVDLS
ncbi:1-aminocyclopropane-1-carboxylate deaminase [Deinococcus sp.]|uniref:1-aminocyclopropane-1-carboxylate deaminase n=1 Tax=Deinococcus sp. TaxID=47478 RepID=UPI0025E92820|nr:1-aminocyclopropane-1-carboxylate deaminase [Deinococcus sp.]